MNQLYEAIGITKQAVHQYSRRQEDFDAKTMILMKEAEQLREEHPGCGIEKMYYTLQPGFIGRDRFVELFMNLGFRLKRKKNYRRTTYSTQVYYPNLIQGKLVNGPCQVWQSDITYIKIDDKFYYAVFIIDVYTKMIVGYQVSDNLRAEANVRALKMALRHNETPDIHHSDKGSQYIYRNYIKLLQDNDIQISMCDTALDNAYAERINQTIKAEYLDHWQIESYAQLKRMVSKAVKHYNNKRLHNHIGRKTPVAFEQLVMCLPEQQRPVIKIYDYPDMEGISNIAIDG
jgi:transposase InsO family protein